MISDFSLDVIFIRKKTLREILNELKWHPERDLTNCEIVYVHRGAPDNKKTISGKTVKTIGPSYFIYGEMGIETFIPFHRIIEIKDYTTGKIIWRRDGR